MERLRRARRAVKTGFGFLSVPPAGEVRGPLQREVGQNMRFLLKKFISDERGVVWVEALLAIPLLTIITIGILEFGTMMWQREQLQNGVRDAARYWARCRPTDQGASYMPCSIQTARNIAFYGDPRGSVDAFGDPNPLRVPGWYDGAPGATLDILPATPPTAPTADSLVSVEGRVLYQGSPLYAAILGDAVTLGYYHTTRYIGW
ncbi:TadE/TadG family type IV pilus assembly protein [Aestuariicoccus sp. MJ-SS9]|uniref:TadE/TadG family type IV pilus assembly protein n=1 Tax=Aestuariicoccus sp. MJ-SS9 TaxID=3079855 RepID=UPI002910C7D4|nr:TadE/TadG family type IV pilus assembly protein [Aestuariicoccus sp. MJ-SS9]MDU8913274.1 TadE/TadG family type IV pilus assembly protein [Aestuariicoccus sp. MJ-SS9]